MNSKDAHFQCIKDLNPLWDAEALASLKNLALLRHRHQRDLFPLLRITWTRASKSSLLLGRASGRHRLCGASMAKSHS